MESYIRLEINAYGSLELAVNVDAHSDKPFDVVKGLILNRFSHLDMTLVMLEIDNLSPAQGRPRFYSDYVDEILVIVEVVGEWGR